MYRYFTIITLILFLTGCGENVEVTQKKFEKEDNYIIKALLAKNRGDYNLSKHYVKLLYDKTDNPVYKKEFIKLTYLNKEYNKTIQLSKNYLDNFKIHNAEVEKYLVLSEFALKDYKQALKISKLLLQKNRSLQNYSFIAFSYLKLKDYKNAIKYFKSMYAIKPSEIIVLKIGDILIKNLNNAKEALSYYQTYIREQGCHKAVCLRMLAIYRFMYDIPNMIAIYEKFIKTDNNPIYKKNLLNLYIQSKMYNKAIKFIKENNYPNEWLLELYEVKKDYKNSAKVSYKLYKTTKAKVYLYKYAIFKFQASKHTKQDAKELVKTLLPIVDKLNSPVIYNYVGYILIDYNINYHKGISLVKKALKVKPNNDYYIDSLAWGYYKLHKCNLAYQEMLKIKTKKEKDIQEHIQKIKRCKNDFKQNYRKNKRKIKNKK